MIRSSSNRGRQGYTLIELMITVAIIGVLASLAVPAYTSYIYETRAAEGPVLVGSIATRQEAYYAEFGEYVDVFGSAYPTTSGWASSAASFTPDASSINGQITPWPATPPAAWNPLGFDPNGGVRMGLTTVAGAPGSQPAGMASDFWFIAAALADLDGDGSYMVFEKTSQNDQVIVSANGSYD